MIRLSAVVFTERALALCLGRELPDEWFQRFECPLDGSWRVLSVRRDSMVFVLDETASERSMRIIVSLAASGFFDLVPSKVRPTALQRIHRIALQAAERNISLPAHWSPYHVDNKIAAFAYQIERGNDRLVAAVMARGKDDPPDLLVCELTTESAQVDLRNYAPDEETYRAATKFYASAVAEAGARFLEVRRPQLEGIVDLEATSYGAVVQGLTYSAWLNRLSTDQRRFVEHPPVRSLKLRGPAGSGKTLALQLKALRLLYDAAEKERPRVAYVTHSWAVAEQAQDALERLDERGLAQEVDVVPLLTLAEASLPMKPPGYRLLGDDSHTGKLEQLHAISRVLDSFRRGDWPVYRRVCSREFAARVEAQTGTVEHDTFVWDLMGEFACVISANGILPGVNALQRYLKIERVPWMMPLENDNDKRVVVLLYTAYIRALELNRLLSNDQIIGDYLNFLATYHWHALRRDRGYDYVIVDELHLFNEQERLVFHQLTRDPDSFPILFMALDPRQSPAETYAEFKIADTTTGESGRASRTFGSPEPIDLTEVYRFTPEILAFLKHIDAHYPALELGEDWGVSIGSARSATESGPTPLLFRHQDRTAECGSVLQRAVDACKGERRVAVLCLDHGSFDRYEGSLAMFNGRFKSIRSRDDVEQLRYSRRKIVVSMPEYVAGLQFDTVLLGGLEARFARYGPHQGYELRRLLAGLYLGASRASRVLEIHFTDAGGGMPVVIDSAVAAGTLKLIEGPGNQ